MRSKLVPRYQSNTDRISVRIRKGLDLDLGAGPAAETAETKSSTASALLGRDYPGTRFEVLVNIDQPVRAGAPLLRDRRRPEIQFTSPVSGTISALNRGARRVLVSLVVNNDGQADAADFYIPSDPDRDKVRQLMLQSGLWTALRCRPYGIIPDPARNPRALLITAIDTHPLAPDPATVIDQYGDEYTLGVNTIRSAVDAPVFVCKAPTDSNQPEFASGVTVAEFEGPHPAGLPGTHIHELCPIGFDGGEVWYIDYQHVISLGHLMRYRRPWFERIVSLAGPAARQPRLLSLPLGTAIEDVVDNELVVENYQLISGSALSGHAAAGYEAYLGQRHHQITVIPEPGMPASSSGNFLNFNHGRSGEPDPMMPLADFDGVAPPGILAVPLMRALLVGDVDRARDLGALELVEEDLALLSYLCPSKTNYGLLLRKTLNQLYREAASTLH